WAQYKNDGHHHHICGHKKAWEDFQVGQVPRYLVHLETSMVLREATADEIAQAANALGIAEVAGESYGVLTMEQLTQTLNAPDSPVVGIPDAPPMPAAVVAPAPGRPPVIAAPTTPVAQEIAEAPHAVCWRSTSRRDCRERRR